MGYESVLFRVAKNALRYKRELSGCWENLAVFKYDRTFLAVGGFMAMCGAATVLYGRISLIYFVFVVSTIVSVTRRIAAGAMYEHHLRAKQLEGKTVLITGATSGIGQMTAFKLGQLAPRKIIVGVRGGVKRAEATAALINSEILQAKPALKDAGLPRVIGVALDLADLESTRSFCKEVDSVLDEGEAIDVSILCAGSYSLLSAVSPTKDGYDALLQGNVIGHHVILEQLMPRILLPTSDKRVVVVSSQAHALRQHTENVPWDSLLSPATNSTRLKQAQSSLLTHYSYTKLAQIYMVREMHRRFEKQGLRIFAVHPGCVSTEIWSALKGTSTWMYRYFKAANMLFARDAERGCQTVLYCALDQSAIPGGYHLECRFVPYCRIAASAEFAQIYSDKMAAICGSDSSWSELSADSGSSKISA